MPHDKKASKHVDSDRKATVASGEKKSGMTMDGITKGLERHVSPPIVDGIVRGVPRHMSNHVMADTSTVTKSATPHSRGMFGSGAFPEGKM